METNEIIQYTIVGVILIAVLIWLVRKVVTMKHDKSSGCSGCSLAESCKKKDLKDCKEGPTPRPPHKGGCCH